MCSVSNLPYFDGGRLRLFCVRVGGGVARSRAWPPSCSADVQEDPDHPREAFVGLDKPPGIVLCMECAREQAVDYSEDEEDGGLDA